MSDERHYIAVDRAMVMRCKWCGSTESEKWITSESDGWVSGTFCSVTCKDAYRPYDELVIAIVFFIIPSLYILIDFDWLFDILLILMFIIPIFIICIIGPFAWGLVNLSAGRKARAITPKNSRRVDRVFDERYLRCENCYAPLEQKDGKTTVKCMYCGVINRTSYS